jgi:nicotinamidase-related amidase
VELEELLQADSTAIVCMEMQRGVVGDLSRLPAADAVREVGAVPIMASLFDAGREVGVAVVHCTAAFRADRRGTYRNMPGINAALENPEYLLVGSPEVQVVPELWRDGDVESQRLHGISPFTATSLDSVLRSLGARTLVVAGVSLNRGIVGLSIEAINRGYCVVVATDCVVGYPAEYARAVLEHTLAPITWQAGSEAIKGVWAGAARGGRRERGLV